jgi:ribosomal protein S27E
MQMIIVKCETQDCLNNDIEIEVQLSYVICGVCNSVLNELLG